MLPIILLLFILLMGLALRQIWIFPFSTEGVPVLMYHKFSRTYTDYLTVSPADFAQQIQYLKTENYQFITAQDLLDFYLHQKPLPQKPVLLTFDDAYISQVEIAYPILKQATAKAAIFAPTNFIGRDSAWDKNPDGLLSKMDLENIDPSVFELALHTHRHQNYNSLSLAEIKADVDTCLQFFKDSKIAYTPVFAYAYGIRPKDPEILRGMKTHFKERGILAAFRIGNWHNPFKIKDLYELRRIDIRGTDSFEDFKKKMRYGRTKLF